MDTIDQKTAQQRQRENRYSAQITARIPDALKERLEALADQELLALGIIVRRVLEAGLPVIEKGEDGSRQSAMEAARQWWQSMDNAQRITWQKRVAPLKGREMIAAAWKQSQGI